MEKSIDFITINISKSYSRNVIPIFMFNLQNDNTHSFPFGELFYGSKCKSDCPYHCKSWNTGAISNIEVPGRGRIADPSLSFVVRKL